MVCKHTDGQIRRWALFVAVALVLAALIVR